MDSYIGYLHDTKLFLAYLMMFCKMGTSPQSHLVSLEETLTLLHSERPILYTILAFLSAIVLSYY